MKQDTTTYYAWIGGSCDYGHKERAGAAAVIVEHGGEIIKRDVIVDLYTTEFRMMLTLMVKTMLELPEDSDILFLTNAAYIKNFDKTPTAKSANPDLVLQCNEAKQRHQSVGVNIVSYHKSPLLIETHDASTEAMKKLRADYNRQKKKQKAQPSIERVVHMEQLHDHIRTIVDSGNKVVPSNLHAAIKELEAYYEGPEWRADFYAERHDFFPKDLKRGILAEDTLYDLLVDIDSLL